MVLVKLNRDITRVLGPQKVASWKGNPLIFTTLSGWWNIITWPDSWKMSCFLGGPGPTLNLRYIYTYTFIIIYHKNQPDVGKYTIHWVFGFANQKLCCHLRTDGWFQKADVLWHRSINLEAFLWACNTRSVRAIKHAIMHIGSSSF